MFGASLWFIFLEIFYYEYVSEDAFAEQEAALKAPETTNKLEDETTDNTEKENEAFKSDEATHESADL